MDVAAAAAWSGVKPTSSTPVMIRVGTEMRGRRGVRSRRPSEMDSIAVRSLRRSAFLSWSST